MPTQPTAPTIDGSNALAASLAFAAVFHEGAGPGTTDLVNSRPGVFSPGQTWDAGAYGGAAVLTPPDTHDGCDFGAYRPIPEGSDWSVVAVIRCDDTTNYRTIISARDNYATLDFSFAIAPGGALIVGNASNYQVIGGTVTQGAWLVVGASINATQTKVYIGGALVGTYAGDLRPVVTGAAANNVRVGGIGTADGAESLGGAEDSVYLWTRSLTGTDQAAISVAPYAFLSPPLTTKYLAFLASDGVRVFSKTN
jgi:hypothetical protein